MIRDSAHRALEDLRDVLGVLRAGRADGDRPVELPDPPQPSLADLQVLVDEARLAGVPVALDCRLSELTSVPETIGRTAYRIVQEGLTNVRKHGNRDEASVAVHGTAGRGLTVEIRNPCPVGAAGASTIPGSGTGIIGLAERTSIVGGRLEHGCSTDGDFRLWAWLPWPL